MKNSTRSLLEEAHKYCDEHDHSTEYMLEYMQSVANVDLDTVLDFLEENCEYVKVIN